MLTFSRNKIPDLGFRKAVKKPIAVRCIQIDTPFEVHTMEGIMKGKKGDWLMIGVKGEIYPCDAEIFKESYDLIE